MENKYWKIILYFTIIMFILTISTTIFIPIDYYPNITKKLYEDKMLEEKIGTIEKIYYRKTKKINVHDENCLKYEIKTDKDKYLIYVILSEDSNENVINGYIINDKKYYVGDDHEN